MTSLRHLLNIRVIWVIKEYFHKLVMRNLYLNIFLFLGNLINAYMNKLYINF